MFTLTGTETTVYSFNSGTEGQKPIGMVQSSDGNFYGVTKQGGASGNGTVFKITSAGVESVLHSFAGGTTDGGQPQAGLLQASDGNFYGTTNQGGATGNSTVFKITPTGVETALHSIVGSATDGSDPRAALLQASDGNFYGTTNQGGLNGFVTVFMVTPAGVESVLLSFNFNTGEGNGPRAALIQGSDGGFYGTTFNGGGVGIGSGTVFKISTTNGASVVYAFGGGVDGSGPNSALIQGSDGNLYGTTSKTVLSRCCEGCLIRGQDGQVAGLARGYRQAHC
jgi:uncharacterized repeat protein (TIGR03803 family)